MAIKYKAILFTIIVVLVLGYFSISVQGDYGWSLFILLPFLTGFLPVFIIGKNDKDLSLNKAFMTGMTTLGILLCCLILFAIEGFICIVMSLPILILVAVLGTLTSYFFLKKFIHTRITTLFLILLSTSFLSFDSLYESKNLIPVTTSVTVNAPIDKVWQNVVTFEKIEETKDWIFKTGISYPTDATIKGKGVGAIRYCNFSTGSFVEPITKWEEPNLLQFDVIEQPIPMNEFNPFWEIHPPHLDGYFMSRKGQFKLTKIDDTKTKLEGTTWYNVDIKPEIYWSIWSDFIIHKIHKRVLNHIKKESETKKASF